MRFLRKAIAHHFLCGSDVSELAFIAEPHQPERREDISCPEGPYPGTKRGFLSGGGH